MDRNDTVNAIYAVLDSCRKNPYGELFTSERVCARLKYFVDRGAPVLMLFPGFHGKIKNRDFVLGSSIDMGESVALENLASLVDRIRRIYAPGVQLDIVHEGHFHVGNSSLIVSEQKLDEYVREFRRLLGKYNGISSITILDIFPNCHSLQDCLTEFYSKFVPSEHFTSELISKSAHYLTLYTAYKKINSIHLSADPGFRARSRRKRNDKIKSAALNQVRIALGFSKAMNSHYEDRPHIRLSSLYKSPEFEDYVSVNYLPGKHHLSTPTFNCLVQFKNGTYDFIKRAEAVAKKYILTEREGLKYFVEAGGATGK